MSSGSESDRESDKSNNDSYDSCFETCVSKSVSVNNYKTVVPSQTKLSKIETIIKKQGEKLQENIAQGKSESVPIKKLPFKNYLNLDSVTNQSEFKNHIQEEIKKLDQKNQKVMQVKERKLKLEAYKSPKGYKLQDIYIGKSQDVFIYGNSNLNIKVLEDKENNKDEEQEEELKYQQSSGKVSDNEDNYTNQQESKPIKEVDDIKKKISGRHFQISYIEDEKVFKIQDLKSTNGTFLSRKQSIFVLKIGMVLQLKNINIQLKEININTEKKEIVFQVIDKSDQEPELLEMEFDGDKPIILHNKKRESKSKTYYHHKGFSEENAKIFLNGNQVLVEQTKQIWLKLMPGQEYMLQYKDQIKIPKSIIYRVKHQNHQLTLRLSNDKCAACGEGSIFDIQNKICGKNHNLYCQDCLKKTLQIQCQYPGCEIKLSKN